MPFESRRLYVQLPCDNGTSMLDDEVVLLPKTVCPEPSLVVRPATPVAGCPLVSRTGMVERGESVVVSPESLAILKRSLQKRLALVQEAEAVLARRDAGTDGGA